MPFAPYEVLKEAFKQPPTTLNKHYTAYDIEDTLFSSIAYYPMACNDKDRISHILFQFKSAYAIYVEARKKDKSATLPSPAESKAFDTHTKEATLKIFREKYGTEFATDEDKYYFDVNNLWTASIGDSGLVIYSALDTNEIKKICSKSKKDKETQ